MKKSVLLTLAAFLLVTYGSVTQADEECIFTSPEASSPLDVVDSATYISTQIWGYRLVLPPSSVLSYAAETNDEDEDDRTHCILAALTVAMKPYGLYPDVESPFELDIVAYADWWTLTLPWPCEHIGLCIALGESTVAAVGLDVTDLDVAYFIARYVS